MTKPKKSDHSSNVHGHKDPRTQAYEEYLSSYWMLRQGLVFLIDECRTRLEWIPRSDQFLQKPHLHVRFGELYAQASIKAGAVGMFLSELHDIVHAKPIAGRLTEYLHMEISSGIDHHLREGIAALDSFIILLNADEEVRLPEETMTRLLAEANRYMFLGDAESPILVKRLPGIYSTDGSFSLPNWRSFLTWNQFEKDQASSADSPALSEVATSDNALTNDKPETK